MALGEQLCLSFGVAKDEQEMKTPRDSIREFASPEKVIAATADDLHQTSADTAYFAIGQSFYISSILVTKTTLPILALGRNR